MLREQGASAVVHGVPRAEPDARSQPIIRYRFTMSDGAGSVRRPRRSIPALSQRCATRSPTSREAERHLRQAQASGAPSF